MDAEPHLSRTERLFVWAGLLIGLVAFALIGLVPSLVWGGTAGIALSRAILGHLVGGELLTSVLALTGMVLFVILAFVLFVAGGTGLGVLTWRLVDASDRPGGRLFRRRRG